MKNIHILPTDKPSKLWFYKQTDILLTGLTVEKSKDIDTQNLYITNDEEIKEGDYWIYICPINGLDYGDNNNPIVKNNLPNSWFNKLHDKLNYKKIILTTDQDLIKDGVQVIDDEFLEWFVKNASCEEVDVVDDWNSPRIDAYEYKIIIPKEEPKQVWEQIIETCGGEEEFMKSAGLLPKKETLEEVAKELYAIYYRFKRNRQQERSYSEEEVLDLLAVFSDFTNSKEYVTFKTLEEWFEQFKKK